MSGEDLQACLRALTERASRGMSFGLDRVVAALAELGDPHEAFAAIHVAGSNGKGSTSAMVEAIARAAGLKTGLYTSPHLCRIAERVRLDGEPIDDAALARALEAVLALRTSELTFFETMTVAAFAAFRDAGVDLAVVEVGLGGRLDATNVLAAPLVTAITSIALEHTTVLGTSRASIAREKAGIFKRGAPVVLGPLEPDADAAATEIARDVGAGPIWRVAGKRRSDGASIGVWRDGDGVTLIPPMDRGGASVVAKLALRGPHQADNAAVAAGIAWRLAERWPQIEPAIAPGLASARWPGRLERIERDGVAIVLDCAHNPHGAIALARSLLEDGATEARTLLVFGAMLDKDWQPILSVIGPLARKRYYAEPEGRAAVPSETLARALEGECVGTPAAAIERALADAKPGDTIVVTGSSYLVGAVRGVLLGIACDAVIPL